MLGAGIFYELLLTGQIKTLKEVLVLQNSILGWIVAGPLQSQALTSIVSNFTKGNIKDLIEKFFIT